MPSRVLFLLKKKGRMECKKEKVIIFIKKIHKNLAIY
jgi:hypothetical protein